MGTQGMEVPRSWGGNCSSRAQFLPPTPPKKAQSNAKLTRVYCFLCCLALQGQGLEGTEDMGDPKKALGAAKALQVPSKGTRDRAGAGRGSPQRQAQGQGG